MQNQKIFISQDEELLEEIEDREDLLRIKSRRKILKAKEEIEKWTSLGDLAKEFNINLKGL
jgi:hypothetical protein